MSQLFVLAENLFQETIFVLENCYDCHSEIFELVVVFRIDFIPFDRNKFISICGGVRMKETCECEYFAI